MGPIPTLTTNHVNVPENEMAVVLADPANDAANAIYFMSYGKFSTQCTGIKNNVGVCPNDRPRARSPARPSTARSTG